MKTLRMTIALSLLAFGLSQSVNATQDCYGAVLDGYTKDSNSFQIHAEEVSEAFESRDHRASTMAIGLLEQKLECSSGAFKISKVSCKEIIPGNSTSKVCYAEARDGYFFVSIDMMEKVNIVFNRWD